MQILYNEKLIEVASGTSLYQFRNQVKPDADILIINGFPVSRDQRLCPDDRVCLIKKGERPTPDELEALMAARHTPGVHQALKTSSVGIAGAGGLGSQVAIALARVGVGRLIIADFDVVEPSNLNRQQYFIDQIGLPKVEALAENLKRINPWTRVERHNVRVTNENIATLFAEVDVMVEAFDAADQKAMISGFWLKKFSSKPLVAGSGMAGCGAANSIRTKKITSRFYLCGDGRSGAGPGMGLMAPRVGIAAHHQANAVVRLLLNENPEIES